MELRTWAEMEPFVRAGLTGMALLVGTIVALMTSLLLYDGWYFSHNKWAKLASDLMSGVGVALGILAIVSVLAAAFEYSLK